MQHKIQAYGKKWIMDKQIKTPGNDYEIEKGSPYSTRWKLKKIDLICSFFINLFFDWQELKRQGINEKSDAGWDIFERKRCLVLTKQPKERLSRGVATVGMFS